jgi:hypothetical protein
MKTQIIHYVNIDGKEVLLSGRYKKYSHCLVARNSNNDGYCIWSLHNSEGDAMKERKSNISWAKRNGYDCTRQESAFIMECLHKSIEI